MSDSIGRQNILKLPIAESQLDFVPAETSSVPARTDRQHSAEKSRLSSHFQLLSAQMLGLEDAVTEKDSELQRVRQLEAELRIQLSTAREQLKTEIQNHAEYVARTTAETDALRLTSQQSIEKLTEQNGQALRRLAELTDQNWGKDIELDRLTKLVASLHSNLDSLVQNRHGLEKQLLTQQYELSTLKVGFDKSQACLVRLKETSKQRLLRTAQQIEAHFAAALLSREDKVKKLLALEKKQRLALERVGVESERYRSEIASLRHQLDLLNHEVSQKGDVIAPLQKMHREEVENLKRSLTALAQEANDKLKRQSQTLAERHSAELRTVRAELELVRDLERKQLQSELKAAQDALTHAKEALAHSEDSFAHARELAETEKATVRQLNEQNIHRLEIEINELRAALQTSRMQLENEKSARQNADRTCKERETRIEKLEQETKVLTMNLNQKVASLHAFENLKDGLLGKIANLETEVASQQAAFEQKEHQRAAEGTRNEIQLINIGQQLDHALKRARTLETERDTSALEIESLKRMLHFANTEAETAAAKREAALQMMTERREQAESLIVALKSELAETRLELSARTKELSVAGSEQERQYENQRATLAQRESQLRQYAATLAENKAAFGKQLTALSEEIQMALKAHPLKDYLALTEFELSKLEVQLKTTPMIAPERKQLEGFFKQMIDQRDFLKTVVTESQRRFEAHARTVLTMLEDPRLSQIPPVRPGRRLDFDAEP